MDSNLPTHKQNKPVTLFTAKLDLYGVHAFKWNGNERSVSHMCSSVTKYWWSQPSIEI